MSFIQHISVVFRVDAGFDIGTGHVLRCLTLADVLRERGAACRFVCRTHTGNLIETIRLRGYAVSELPIATVSENDASAYATWLGADWSTDVEETRAALGAKPVDCLVVDHYAIDARWESALRSHCHCLMAIDDLADRTHNCDLLLDQNWHGEATAMRYRDRVSECCKTLLGPSFALLRPEYAQLRALLPVRDGFVRRVLVSFGGSDPSNETAKTLAALDIEGLREIALDIVIGANYPAAESLTRAAAVRPLTTVHYGIPWLGGLMARADLMIGAGGSTTWERMCLGLPGIVISIAENQSLCSRSLGKAGAGKFLGEAHTVTVPALTRAVHECLEAPDVLKQQSALIRSLVAGDGAAKVADALVQLAAVDVVEKEDK